MYQSKLFVQSLIQNSVENVASLKFSSIKDKNGTEMVSYGFLFAFSMSACFPVNYAELENNRQPEVTIPQGTLRGTILTSRKGRNISAFLRIPYGQPPTGNLRFANPVAANGWNGTLDSSVKASMCAQKGSNGMAGEEDCLYVKVYTPQLPGDANSSLLPVMVYIHGGGFQLESPTGCGPQYLLDADVVLVTINYRLGLLGFLSTGDEVASGNWGLKDQVLALKWVRDNVQYFGGDPNQVTLFGESAGAGSVHLLTLSNTTIGLFHKYITQSGSALATWAHRPRAAYAGRAFKFGEYIGCSNETSDSLISCLRTIDFAHIVANATQFSIDLSLSTVPWGPTDEPDIEGAILTDSPSNLFAAGSIRDLPWMSGVVRDEGLLITKDFYEDEKMLYDFLENIDTRLPVTLDWSFQSDSGAAWTSAAKSYYFESDLTTNASDLLTNLTMLIGDSHFCYPARKALEQHHAIAVNPQYFYIFNYKGTFSFSSESSDSPVNYGVRHADDLIYLFPMDSEFSHLNETMSQMDYEMVDAMVKLWTSFAINGTPTAAVLSDGITWESYSAEDKYLRIGNYSDVTLEVQSSFFPERMQFWFSLEAFVKTTPAVSSSATSATNFNLLLAASCCMLKILFSPAGRL